MGRITKWVKKYQKAKEIFMDGYQEDLAKYPVKVESGGKSGGSKGGVAAKKGQKDGKGKPAGKSATTAQGGLSPPPINEKEEEGSGAGGFPDSARQIGAQGEERKMAGRERRPTKKKKSGNQKGRGARQVDLAYWGAEEPCPPELLDRFYQEFEIPKRELFDACPPPLDVAEVLGSALSVDKVQNPDEGETLSADLGGVMDADPPTGSSSTPYRGAGKLWGVNLQDMVFKCLIEAQRRMPDEETTDRE